MFHEYIEKGFNMKNAVNPIASASNTVERNQVRFTVLTERIVRMEFAEDASFEDRQTLAVSNRETPPVHFFKETHENFLQIQTSFLKVTCSNCSVPFSEKTLTATILVDGQEVLWHYGQQDQGNLLGTCRTLDKTCGDWEVRSSNGTWIEHENYAPVTLSQGLLSRSGWAVYDDSANIPLDFLPDSEALWITPRKTGTRQDLYLLGYGLAYKTALKEASMIFGRQPVPPRYTLGYWYCRYWAYTDKELEELIAQFNRIQLPIDVLAIDMDWHLAGWTGFTWCPVFFPDHQTFLSDLKEQDLKITLNVHPADGVGKHETQFAAVCQDMGMMPEKMDCVPFDCTDPKFMASYFKRLYHPMEQEGIDFWWIDWQQGTKTKMEGVDPLPWLNRLHWEDHSRKERNGLRPLTFSRFGGLGSGRYPIGFSGDTVSVWESLAYQPYFTSTAANVLYGYWSHDIGGNMPGPIEPELYLRWIQFGIYSPILRTHTAKHSGSERRVWKYPSPFDELMIEAIQRRYTLIPYIYAANRRGMDTGISLLHPMYYEWPKEPAAYEARGQYLFGDAMLVAPVVQKADSLHLVQSKIWLPEGEWVDTATDTVLVGGGWVERTYLLRDIPVFVRKGTILPLQGETLRIQPGAYSQLILEVYPGADGETEIYEDDGVSQAYLQGESSRIPISLHATPGRSIIQVKPAVGDFTGFRNERSLEIRQRLSSPATKVLVNGTCIPWSRKPQEGCWSFQGDRGEICVKIAKWKTRKGLSVEIQTNAEFDRQMDGFLGLMQRLDYVKSVVDSVLPNHTICNEERTAAQLAQTGNRITRFPDHFEAEMSAFVTQLPHLQAALCRYRESYEALKMFDRSQVLTHAIEFLERILQAGK